MLIQEKNIKAAVNYLLGLDEHDINPAFKGHAKEWLHHLRETWVLYQTDSLSYVRGLHDKSILQQHMGKLLEPANCLASVLTVESKEHFIRYLVSSPIR